MAGKGNGRIIGLDTVMKNLNREIQKIRGRSMKGLIEATIYLRRDMEDTPPTIPIKDGNLRASWFVTTVYKVQRGGAPKFKGEQADRMSADHASVTSKMKAQISAFKRTPIVAMGFSANYAVFVHEMKGAKFSKAGSGAGFFSGAISRNKGKMVEIIKKHARLI